ncbi:AP-3 complex subunit mu isoform X3 [Mangifera indica]|uniref:AP-3 complex subunit mu isoform X3 n=1 Tax=Mangifera indica TaxID=29780 RepID=UPI001CFA4B6E|nr:AP-3 complex subunit mu isoform X3 [Mangifera indica]
MLQCIFLLSDSGEVMLEKQLTGHRVDRSICAWFWDHVISQGESFKSMPVIASPTHYLFQIVREGITFLACTQLEMPPLMGIEFLCRVADVLSDYLGGLNEDLVKDNFVIVYEALLAMLDGWLCWNLISIVIFISSCHWQLLDEMIDNGFPLTTEPNILREMIAPPNIVSKMLSVVTGNSSNVSETLPGATASCVPWRTTDVKYANNEVYVDLVEEMDAIINRVKKLKSTPIYVKPQLTSNDGTCRISVMIGIRNDPGKTIDSITLQFQLPPCVLSADLTANHGEVDILSNKMCSWSIGRIPKDKAPSLTGTMVLETGLERLHVFPTFLVGFRIMGIALSGLQIDKLDLKNVPNRLYKGFRALTRAGEYGVRS